MPVRPGRNETADRADLCLTVRGPHAVALMLSPKAQQLLCGEIARAMPGVLRSLGDFEDYYAAAEYHAVVCPVKVTK